MIPFLATPNTLPGLFRAMAQQTAEIGIALRKSHRWYDNEGTFQEIEGPRRDLPTVQEMNFPRATPDT